MKCTASYSRQVRSFLASTHRESPVTTLASCVKCGTSSLPALTHDQQTIWLPQHRFLRFLLSQNRRLLSPPLADRITWCLVSNSEGAVVLHRHGSKSCELRRLSRHVNANKEAIKRQRHVTPASYRGITEADSLSAGCQQLPDVSTSFNADAELHGCPERDLSDGVANA